MILFVKGAKTEFRNVDDDGRGVKLMRQPAQSFQGKLELSHPAIEWRVEIIECLRIDQAIRLQTVPLLKTLSPP